MVYGLIGLCLLQGAVFVWLFWRAARTGQFDDMEAGKYEMLRLDEETWRKENGIG
jgi:cbb3-type cytochrome oxidase maturation protein